MTQNNKDKVCQWNRSYGQAIFGALTIYISKLSTCSLFCSEQQEITFQSDKLELNDVSFFSKYVFISFGKAYSACSGLLNYLSLKISRTKTKRWLHCYIAHGNQSDKSFCNDKVFTVEYTIGHEALCSLLI